MTLQKRSYSTGHFELQIDGHSSPTYLKSVEGGFARAQAVDEPVGPSNKRIKHMSTVDIEPFSIDFGIAGAGDVLKWISSSWRKNWGRRNGSVSHGNFELFKTFEHEFLDALITETTFPKLDVKAKDAAYMKVKVQPEKIFTKKLGASEKMSTEIKSKQKLWTPNAFRFNVDGIDEMRYTTDIEAITIKQGIKKLYTGEGRFPQIEPTKIEFPNISGTISLQYADKLIEWHDQYVMSGKSDPISQKTGSIEFLSPDRKKTLFAINLFDLGIQHLSVQNSQGNQDGVKKVKFELYCGRMDLDGSGALGME
jgi:hypothetical protein